MEVITQPEYSARTRTYLEYLKTPEWRATRNRALQRAGYKCEQCDARRELQVHHRTYDRVGRELDTDLQVLCGPCHEGVHPEEQAFRYARRYLAIARDVLATRAVDTFVDFTDAVKVRCARNHLPYNTEKIARAVEIVFGEHVGATRPEGVLAFIDRVQDRPPSAEEARHILRTLGLYGQPQLIKTIAKVEPVTQRDADRMKALEMVAREMQASIARCEALEREVVP